MRSFGPQPLAQKCSLKHIGLACGISLLLVIFVQHKYWENEAKTANTDATRYKERYKLMHHNLQALLSDRMHLSEQVTDIRRDAQAQRDLRDNELRIRDELRDGLKSSNQSISKLHPTVRNLELQLANTSLQLQAQRESAKQLAEADSLRRDIDSLRKKLTEISSSSIGNLSAASASKFATSHRKTDRSIPEEMLGNQQMGAVGAA